MKIDINEINDSILNKAKNIFGENLSCIFLGGSAGKNCFVENWSDLDYYIIIKNDNLKEIEEFSQFLSTFEIHIGYTILSNYEIVNHLFMNRVSVAFFEISTGSDLILYKEESFEFPKITKEEITKYCDIEISTTLFEIKRKTNSSFRTLFKLGLLLKKLLTRKKGAFPYTFEEIDTSYEKYYNSKVFPLSYLFTLREEENGIKILKDSLQEFIDEIEKTH